MHVNNELSKRKMIIYSQKVKRDQAVVKIKELFQKFQKLLDLINCLNKH